MDSALKGKTTIAAKALMPLELVTEVNSLSGVKSEDTIVMTLEAQWKSYVEGLAKMGVC